MLELHVRLYEKQYKWHGIIYYNKNYAYLGGLKCFYKNIISGLNQN